MKTSLASELAGGIACPTKQTFTRPGVVFVGQAVLPAKSASGLSSHLRVPGKTIRHWTSRLTFPQLRDSGLRLQASTDFLSKVLQIVLNVVEVDTHPQPAIA